MYKIEGKRKVHTEVDGSFARNSGSLMAEILNTEKGVERWLEEWRDAVENITITELYTNKDLTSKFLGEKK